MQVLSPAIVLMVSVHADPPGGMQIGVFVPAYESVTPKRTIGYRKNVQMSLQFKNELEFWIALAETPNWFPMLVQVSLALDVYVWTQVGAGVELVVVCVVEVLVVDVRVVVVPPGGIQILSLIHI